MMTYTMPCADGHDPEMLMVEAGNDDEAMMKMVEKVHEHHEQRHPEMKDMSDEDVKKYVMEHWSRT